MPKTKKTNTLVEKTILLQKNPYKFISKKGHRTVNRLPKCLKPKKQTLSLKKQCCFKKACKFISKKMHKTVFQNAWSKKNKHSHWKNNVSKKLVNSYEKRPQNRLPKCLNPKKTTLSLKKQFCFKKAYEKRPQNRFPKCLKPKKPTLSLKKQFCFKKAYKFIWKNTTEPLSKVPETKKTNTLVEKTILLQKTITNSYRKKGTEPSSKMPEPKKPTLSLKKYFCVKNVLKKSNEKATEPSSKMPEAKTTNTLIEKNNSVWKKLTNSYEKMTQNHLPKCLKPKKQTLSLKKPFCFKKAYKFK